MKWEDINGVAVEVSVRDAWRSRLMDVGTDAWGAGAVLGGGNSLVFSMDSIDEEMDVFDCVSRRIWAPDGGLFHLSPSGGPALPVPVRDEWGQDVQTMPRIPLAYIWSGDSVVVAYQTDRGISVHDCLLLRNALISIRKAAAITMPNGSEGYLCLDCQQFFPYVEANQPNGYICRECRTGL